MKPGQIARLKELIKKRDDAMREIELTHQATLILDQVCSELSMRVTRMLRNGAGDRIAGLERVDAQIADMLDTSS